MNYKKLEDLFELINSDEFLVNSDSHSINTFNGEECYNPYQFIIDGEFINQYEHQDVTSDWDDED